MLNFMQKNVGSRDTGELECGGVMDIAECVLNRRFRNLSRPFKGIEVTAVPKVTRLGECGIECVICRLLPV